jgi:transcriptional regulator with XRE-family HTH domain
MVETITPEQCRAARGLLGLTQEQLCEKAGITHKPLVDYEKGKTKPYPRTLKALRHALEKAGVVFVDPNGDGPGVRLKGK